MATGNSNWTGVPLLPHPSVITHPAPGNTTFVLYIVMGEEGEEVKVEGQQAEAAPAQPAEAPAAETANVYRPGALVWAKVVGFGLWPAQVMGNCMHQQRGLPGSMPCRTSVATHRQPRLLGPTPFPTCMRIDASGYSEGVQ